MKKHAVAVLISGNGSNLQALIDAAAASDYPAYVALVISNKPEVYGLKRAEKAGIPALALPHAAFSSREGFDRALHAALLDANIEAVCLAGFMRLLTPWLVEQWQGRMLNIHPSLLPDFKGAHAVRDTLAAGVAETGCTVHLVTAALDSGPILAQGRVPVLAGDTEQILASRIHGQEHLLYPEALRCLLNRL